MKPIKEKKHKQWEANREWKNKRISYKNRIKIQKC